MTRQKEIKLTKLKDIFSDVKNPPYTYRWMVKMAKTGQIKTVNVGLGKIKPRYMVTPEERDRIRAKFGL